MLQDGKDRFQSGLLSATAAIVSAYAGKTAMTPAQLTVAIASVGSALSAANKAARTLCKPPTPAVPIKKSVTSDRVICLEDGQPFKMLKQHLRPAHGMSFDEYRERWA